MMTKFYGYRWSVRGTYWARSWWDVTTSWPCSTRRSRFSSQRWTKERYSTTRGWRTSGYSNWRSRNWGERKESFRRVSPMSRTWGTYIHSWTNDSLVWRLANWLCWIFIGQTRGLPHPEGAAAGENSMQSSRRRTGESYEYTQVEKTRGKSWQWKFTVPLRS